ncbi:MAG: mechanosensitive ion channel, partial [Chloroflexia bacterium]|nr:mechanosensitive ion channel [Chloroflexia bacterium]
QYAVGDFVRIDPVSGTVEELNLRRTVLRSVEGAAIVIPNGDVRIIENLSKGWSRAIIDMNVSPEADDDQVMAVLHEVFDGIQLDPDVGAKIVEEPTILGLTTVSTNQITYRVMIKTLPSEQWVVERTLRRRLRDRLILRGISFPGTVPAALVDMVEGPG